MGPIYTLESELQSLCTNYDNNASSIYLKLRILAHKIIMRNRSKIGPDVVISELDHEIAAYITLQLKSGKKIEKFSGYIKRILPIMVGRNAHLNSHQYINTSYEDGVDIISVLDMSYSSAKSILESKRISTLLCDLPNLPKTLRKWALDNIKYCSDIEFNNFYISLLLSLINNNICLFRLDESKYDKFLFYLNKSKIFLSKLLINNNEISSYDQLKYIVNIESLEDNCNDSD